jgi:hypothetical protein
MRGAIPPLSNTPSWHGAQFKKKAQGQLCLNLYCTVTLILKNSLIEAIFQHRTAMSMTKCSGMEGQSCY